MSSAELQKSKRLSAVKLVGLSCVPFVFPWSVSLPHETTILLIFASFARLLTGSRRRAGSPSGLLWFHLCEAQQNNLKSPSTSAGDRDALTVAQKLVEN